MKNLAIAAAIAICIAMYFASATASPLKESAAEIDAKQQRNKMAQSSSTAANEASVMPEFRVRRQSRRENARREQEKDCTESVMEGQCTPSAQLASTGMQWSGINEMTEKYNTNWICNEDDAFVDCGMNFTYNDQKLHVPVCGIYEIYSQILFRHESTNSAVVYHNVEVSRGCSHSTDNTAEFKSYSGLVPILDSSTVTWATTTNLATVKMCAGGTVSVVIPQDSACCAWGGKSSTYFSARLISEVNCTSIQ